MGLKKTLTCILNGCCGLWPCKIIASCCRYLRKACGNAETNPATVKTETMNQAGTDGNSSNHPDDSANDIRKLSIPSTTTNSQTNENTFSQNSTPSSSFNIISLTTPVEPTTTAQCLHFSPNKDQNLNEIPNLVLSDSSEQTSNETPPSPISSQTTAQAKAILSTMPSISEGDKAEPLFENYKQNQSSNKSAPTLPKTFRPSQRQKQNDGEKSNQQANHLKNQNVTKSDKKHKAEVHKTTKMKDAGFKPPRLGDPSFIVTLNSFLAHNPQTSASNSNTTSQSIKIEITEIPGQISSTSSSRRNKQ